MNKIYKTEIYNLFLKELRKNNNYTIKDISILCHMSTGTICTLENSINIQTNPKTKKLLSIYSLDENYLINLETVICKYICDFFHTIVYAENFEEVESKYLDLSQFASLYKDSILALIFILSDFIYNIYTNKHIKSEKLKLLDANKIYLSEEYKSLCNIYLGRFYLQNNDFNMAKFYYDEALFDVQKDNTYCDMLYYNLASYYARTGDILTSTKYSDMAMKLFTESGNYLRLINTKTILALQYLELRDFSSALKINLENLNNISGKNLDYEKKSLLNNIAYIYMIQGKYMKAKECFKEMNPAYMQAKHYCYYLITLFELGDYDKASLICEKGIEINKTTTYKSTFYRDIFNAYRKCFKDQDLHKFTNQLSKLYSRYSDKLNSNQKELLLTIIVNNYKKVHQIKKAFTYLEYLYQNSIK